MHLKQNATCLGRLLLFVFTFTSVGWCDSFLTPPEALHRLQPGAAAAETYVHAHPPRGGSEVTTNTSSGGVGQKLKMKLVSSVRSSFLRNRYRRRHTEGEWLFAAQTPPSHNCSAGLVSHVVPGKFYISGQLEQTFQQRGYQSDSASSGKSRGSQARVRGQEESWQKLMPVVECGEEAMTLTVRRRRAVQLFLDRANESSVALFQLPPHCGYAVQTNWRDLSLMAQYDACHVSLEEGRYVLPLLWKGTPIKVSCPVSQLKLLAVGPSSLCCSPYGMTVRVEEVLNEEEPSINVRGEWTPLVLLAEQCDYTLDKEDGEIVIAVPFLACGITIKDGKYTLSLQTGQRIYTLACPVSPPEGLLFTHQPLAEGSAQFRRRPAKPLLESFRSMPWIRPFYLAPPYYPHPTFHSNVPPSPPSFSPIPSGYNLERHPQQIFPEEMYEPFRSNRPFLSGDHMKDLTQKLPDQKQKPEPPVLDSNKPSAAAGGFPYQVQTSDSPSHDFSPYYHFYHHPKIPLPGSQDSNSGLESSTNPHSFRFPAVSDVQQASDVLQQSSPPKTPPYPDTIPIKYKPPAPYPSHFLPYYLYSYPPTARGEARRLGLINPHLVANLSYFHTYSTYDKSSINARIKQAEVDQTEDFSNTKPNLDERRSSSVTPAPQPPVPPRYPPKPKLAAAPLPEQSSVYRPNSYQYFYHPFYGYYLLYYPPAAWSGTVSHMSAGAPKPLPQSSSLYKHPASSSPPTPLLLPYYYYYFDQPQVPKYIQGLYSPGNKDQPESPFALSADYGWIFSPASDGRIPSAPLAPHSALQSYYMNRHPLGQPSGYTREKEYNLIREYLLRTNPYSPAVPLCGFGLLLNPDCTNHLSCCSHTFKDGIPEQYFVFAVPDSVLEPSLLSAGNNTSCSPQRLTSDLGIFIVPVEGCGVNKHMLGHTLIHLLEVHGTESSKEGKAEKSPVRMTVGCSSSPYIPGEVRFHTMAEPSLQTPPAPVTVLLKLATEESFTSFYPEARLPLSLVLSKPVYAELSLLDPSEPSMLLLVHSCLAYTLAPYLSWMLLYDGCPKQGISQLLPSPDSRHIKRMKISVLPSLPTGSSSHSAQRRLALLEDPEVYFLCMTEVCSTASGDCSLSCKSGPNSDQ